MAGQNELSSRSADNTSPMAQSAKELAKKMRLEGEFERVELTNIPISIIEALYHEVTGNTERFSTSFYDEKKILYEDVNDIFIRMQSTIEKYKPIASSYTISYILSDGRKYKFSDWLKFSSFDYRTMSRTSGLVVEFNFLLKSEIDTPNRYKIEIELGSGVGYFEHIELDDVQKWYKNKDKIATAVMRAEYINTLVMKDFYSVIKEWYGNLHPSGTGGPPKWLRKMMKYEFEIIIGAFVGATATSGVVSTIVAQKMTSIHDLVTMYAVATYSTICTFLVALFLMGLAITNLYDSVGLSVIQLTAGDNNEIVKMQKKNGKRITRFWFYFLTSIISIMLNVVSSAIYDRI